MPGPSPPPYILAAEDTRGRHYEDEVGVERRRRSHLLQSVGLLGGEVHARRGDVLGDLLGPARTDETPGRCATQAAARIVNIASSGGSLTLNSDPTNPHRAMFGTYSSSKTALNTITWQWIDDDDSVHSGQHNVGVVVTTSMTKPFSLSWVCSIRIPSARNSREVSSIIPSL